MARVALGLFVLLALSAWFGVRASGQQPRYEEIKLPANFDDAALVRRMETEARNFATSGSGREDMAKYYFRTYVPAKMTQPAALPELSEMVDNAYTLLVRSQQAGNGNATKILSWLGGGMKAVAEGNYYPPARINAVLVLGRLDQQALDQVNRTPPVPLSAALPILLAQYNDENNVDGVRAAALQGIHRHVIFNAPRIAEQTKTAIKTAMEQLLQSNPPTERSDQAHAYLQRFAVDILDLLRPQDDPTLGVQLVGLSTQKTRPNLIALHSIARLGSMSQVMQGKIDQPADVLNSWTARALTAFEEELKRLNALERPKQAQSQPPLPEDTLENRESKPATNRMAMGMGMEDEMMGGDMGYEEMMNSGPEMDEMEMGDPMDAMMMEAMGGSGMLGGQRQLTPQEPEVIASRRKLNHVMQLMHLGVTGSPTKGKPRQAGGMLAMVSAEKKPEVEAWITNIEPVLTEINNLEVYKLEDYKETLIAQIEVLRGLAGVEADAVAEQELGDLLGGMLDKAADAAAPADPAAADQQPAADAEVVEELASP